MSKELEKWEKRIKRKKISNIAIICLAILSIVFIIVTIYGVNVGNFVVSVDNKTKIGLSMSETNNFDLGTTRLLADPLEKQQDTTLENIPIDQLLLKDGSNNDIYRKYFAYSFYVKNVSDRPISYEMQVSILQVTKKMDSAIRILIARDGEKFIYAKPQETGSDIGKPEDYPYLTLPFNSPSAVCKFSNSQMNVDIVEKYTIIFWLEGYDQQCTDKIMGGEMKMEMKFVASDIKN